MFLLSGSKRSCSGYPSSPSFDFGRCNWKLCCRLLRLRVERNLLKFVWHICGSVCLYHISTYSPEGKSWQV